MAKPNTRPKRTKKVVEAEGVAHVKATSALHDIGIKTAYHTCGKMMAQLDLVKETGCDATETLTPPDMGGDADLRKMYNTRDIEPE